MDYLRRTGQVDQAYGWDVLDRDRAELGATRLMDGALGRHAAEDWVAEGPDGRIIGWAQSIERDGMLELTMFFVDPTSQSRGVGRGLLERAFPLGRGHTRTISATQDPRALALYLRFGVAYVTTSIDVLGGPRACDMATDLAIEPSEQGTGRPPRQRSPTSSGRCSATPERVDTRFLLGRTTGVAGAPRRKRRRSGVRDGRGGHRADRRVGSHRSSGALGHCRERRLERGMKELGFTIPMINRDRPWPPPRTRLQGRHVLYVHSEQQRPDAARSLHRDSADLHLLIGGGVRFGPQGGGVTERR